MKIIFTILIFVSLECFSQTSYKIFWTTNAEIEVSNYEIQLSQDTINWYVLATVLPIKNPDSNKYSYPLPFLNSWVRLDANMTKGNYHTQPLYFKGDTTTAVIPMINNAVTSKGIYTDILTWNTLNENNLVNYYLIEKSKDSVNFSSISQSVAKGDSKYTVTVYRFSGKKPVYRVTTFLKTGVSLPPIIFQ